jgi:aminoglycoside 3-N-acetyltransferase I
MSYSYKKLESADVVAFKNLLKVFGEAFKEPHTYQDAVPSGAYLEKMLAGENFIVVVASSGKEVVGGLAAYVLEKFERERKEIYIYDLAVREDHRMKGVATALIGKLKEIARERGAYIIYVQADPEDLPAIKLYESLGIKEEVFHFDIPVD